MKEWQLLKMVLIMGIKHALQKSSSIRIEQVIILKIVMINQNK